MVKFSGEYKTIIKNNMEELGKLGTQEQLNKNAVRDMNEFRNKPFEEQYAISLLNILENGTLSGDRTGTGTKRIQSQQITIDLEKEFPILLGKKVNFRNALIEMIWIMSGRNDNKFLKDNGVNYWDSWVKPDGTFGPIYGVQMRNFLGIDQLVDTIYTLIKDPDSRRLVISLWNPKDNPQMALTCCHHDYQLSSFVNNEGERQLDLHTKQRSSDSFVGVPYDLMLFSVYLLFVSEITGIKVGKIHTTNADYHMYVNHEKQVNQYLNNYFEDKKGLIHSKISKPTLFQNYSFRPDIYLDNLSGPEKIVTKEIVREVIEYFLAEIISVDFNYWTIKNYNSYPFIKVPVAV